MPRSMAPQPHAELHVKLTTPFAGTATHTVEIIGEPNRNANIKRIEHQNGTIIEKTGDMGKEDVQELMSLISQLRGFPSHATNDVYGLNKTLELNTLEINWSNEEDDPASNVVNEVPAETKQTFKDVVDSIEAAARTFAKQDSRV